MDGQNELERMFLYEHVRKSAEMTYAKNPKDADNLTKWGGALLELSQFQSVHESKQMMSEAILKLEEALSINPRKHDTLWCLGNAYTSSGFMTPERILAMNFFERASECFQKAVDEEPQNELYLKSLQLTSKAPELHMEVHKPGGLGQQIAGGGSSSSSNMKGSTKKNSSDLKYDLLGWVILAVGIVTWLGFAKSQLPPPPPPPG